MTRFDFPTPESPISTTLRIDSVMGDKIGDEHRGLLESDMDEPVTEVLESVAAGLDVLSQPPLNRVELMERRMSCCRTI